MMPPRPLRTTALRWTRRATSSVDAGHGPESSKLVHTSDPRLVEWWSQGRDTQGAGPAAARRWVLALCLARGPGYRPSQLHITHEARCLQRRLELGDPVKRRLAGQIHLSVSLRAAVKTPSST